MNIPKLPNVRGFLSVGKAFTMAHRPELLFGASIASTVAAVVMAAKGGYEARGIIEKESVRRWTDAVDGLEVGSIERSAVIAGVPDLTLKEKVSLTWICYLPAAGLTGAALGSTVGLHLVHVKDKKAIAAAALMAIDEIKNEANDYKEKVLDIVTDNGATDDEKRARIEELTPEAGWNTADVILESHQYWCFDDLANRPVKTNRDLIRRAGEVLLAEINKTGKGDLNLFYDELDLAPSQMGSSLGWTKEDVQGYGGKKGMEFISFGLTDLPNGGSAVAFWFREPPTTDFQERAAS